MNLAFSDAFRIVRNFRGVFPRCQTKNRIKSISLFDLGISNPCRKMVLPLELLPYHWITPVIAIWCGPSSPG